MKKALVTYKEFEVQFTNNTNSGESTNPYRTSNKVYLAPLVHNDYISTEQLSSADNS
jgi:hypothetical protein